MNIIKDFSNHHRAERRQESQSPPDQYMARKGLSIFFTQPEKDDVRMKADIVNKTTSQSATTGSRERKIVRMF